MLNPPQSPPQQQAVGTDAFAKFGEVGSAEPQQASPDFTALAHSPEFHALRRALRGFAFPMCAVFLAWYLAYVLIAAYLPDFMSTRITGEINVGLVMGVGQFASTLLITVGYLRFAARAIDPKVARLRGTGAEAPR